MDAQPHEPLVMHVTTIAGNLFAAAEKINKCALAAYVRTTSYSVNYTQVVLVLPKDVLDDVLARKLIW